MKLRHLLPTLNTIFFAFVAGVFVQNHGGVKGDFTYLGSVTDAPTEPGDYGRVFFNRWQFYGDRETALTQTYLLANIPGFGAAKATLWVLRNTFEEFQTSYPFGLSFASYSLMLGFLFSLFQWFSIGALLDWLRRRAAPALAALTLLMIWINAGTASAMMATPVGRLSECGYDSRPGGNIIAHLGAQTEACRELRTGPGQFTSKERDAETGLDYFGARYMSSAQGRFTSPDSTAYSKMSNPQSWNLYAYSFNNPLAFIDPTGDEVQAANCGTEAECQKTLAAVQGALANKQAASRVGLEKIQRGFWGRVGAAIAGSPQYRFAISGDMGSFHDTGRHAH